LDDAITDFKQSLKLFPALKALKMDLVEVLLEAKKYGEAQKGESTNSNTLP